MLTLGNEEQTWTMDTGGAYGGWERGKLKKKKELARKKMEAAVPLLRSQKHTKQKVDG